MYMGRRICGIHADVHLNVPLQAEKKRLDANNALDNAEDSHQRAKILNTQIEAILKKIQGTYVQHGIFMYLLCSILFCVDWFLFFFGGC